MAPLAPLVFWVRLLFLVSFVVFLAVFVMYLRSGKGRSGFEPSEEIEEYFKDLVREEVKVALGERSPMYHTQARILECGGTHGLREDLYKAAECTLGLYKANGCAVERDGEDLLIDVAFNTKDNAVRFMTSLKNLCGWSHIEYDEVVIEVFEGEVMTDHKGASRMIVREDYNPEETTSPEGTPSHSTSAQTFLLATEPLTRFQSVERPSLFRSSKPHACHIIDKKLLPKHLKHVVDENNLLAMTGTMHSMYDGTTRDEDIPTIRISADEETRPSAEGRQEVVLKIEALNEEVADDVECFLRKGFRREAGRFLYVSVFVKDVELFKYNLSFKHERTSRRWKKYGHDEESSIIN